MNDISVHQIPAIILEVLTNRINITDISTNKIAAIKQDINDISVNKIPAIKQDITDISTNKIPAIEQSSLIQAQMKHQL
jgi:hypothetical protein